MRDGETPRERRRRRVLASLVPVENREDPLAVTRLASTDVEICSALALRKSVAPSLTSVVDGSSNQHEDAVVDLDRRIDDAKRRWAEHQQQAFAAQVDALQSLTPRRSTHVQQRQQQQQQQLQLEAVADGAATLVKALDTAHNFLQRAGDELSLASTGRDHDGDDTDDGTAKRWQAMHALYVQALAHLTATVTALGHSSSLQAEQ